MFERYLETYKEQFLRIPISGNMYSIDIKGQIRTTDGEFIQPTLDADNNLVAWLYLWDGWKNYQVAILVAFAFKPTRVPFSLWNKLTVLFKDGNKQNVHPENLVWKFPQGGLLCKQYENYAYIPGCSRYVINKEGNVINLNTGLCVVGRKTPKGYTFHSIRPDIGGFTSISKSRLMGLAWLEYSNLVDTLQINHINKKTNDDRLENLEWTTNHANKVHSVVFNEQEHNEILKQLTDIKVILSRNIITGELNKYKNIKDCIKNTNLNINSIVYRLNNKQNSVYPDFLQFKFEEDEWKEVNENELNLLLDSLDTTILVRNVKTNEITEYLDGRICSIGLGITYHHALYRLNLPNQPIFPGYLQMQKKGTLTNWREPVNLEEEHQIALHGRSVLMRNVLTGEIKEYNSAAQCAHDLGLCELAISVRLRDNSQKVYPGNLQFKRKYDLTPWKEFKGIKEDFANGHYAVKVRVKNIFTNEIFIFDSIEKTSTELNIPTHVVMDRKNNKNNFPYFQYEIRFKEDEFKNYSETDLKMFKQSMDEGKPFRGRGFILTDIDTNEVLLFIDRNALVKRFGLTKAHFSELAQLKKVFRNKWRIEYYFN